MVDTGNTDKKTTTDPPSGTGSFEPVPLDPYTTEDPVPLDPYTEDPSTGETVTTEDPTSGTSEPT